ncbi:MAG TPA: NAD+ synthase [Candidatus Sumerlaeota bacterium]|nr:NAD+ synthase [Candidatus Sumerlaeota bacterium]HON51308.1 NAD+ synthase [Candidatus Sumerlaeota bacterium]HOR65686.1 NAD+ synthase [Candidatus Sumerlaeota bacterium]HPL73743.1 NAD+ synthase [Candidatus Sumerlaeota bacterium]HRU54809.1 NAD+ synthase [Candidatus Sumerlaeia bacterium]
MKICLSQINTIVGDIEYNTQRIIDEIETTRKAGVDLIIFPEMTILGYPPRDLLFHNKLINDNLVALERIAAQTRGIGAIIGCVVRNPAPVGKGFFNAAVLCADGGIVSRHYKTLIPAYDVFDEPRYFDPAPSVQKTAFKGLNLGITICEDIWNFPAPDGNRRLYKIDPVKELSTQGIDILINISASPFTLGKRPIREYVMRETARRCGVPVVHVNHLGGNDSIIFDGWSIVIQPDGQISANTRDFAEDRVIYDTETKKGDIRPATQKIPERLLEALKCGLSDYVRKCGFKKTVLGLSGGVDSAIVAVIAVEALGRDRVVGVSMPSQFTSQESLDDAAALAKNLGIEYITIPIEKQTESFLELLKPQFEGTPFNETEENIQARVRATILMALSNKFGWLVLSTGNKSELAMGYCTLYGDMSGGLAVISDVPKTLIYELCEWINRESEIIPRSTIEKPPSAELRPNQKDTDSLPPYDILDPIIREYVEEHRSVEEIAARLGHDLRFVQGIVRTISRNEYKRRQAAPGFKVTSRAFGEGWRMPIAASWGK